MAARLLAVLALVLAAAGCGGSEPAAEGVAAAPAPSVTDVAGVDTVRAAFNRGAGEPRLVLLLSPT